MVIVLVILTGSAVYDLRDHRIPNWWVLGGVCIGLLLQVWFRMGQTEKLWWIPVWFCVRGLIVVLIFFPLFHVRMIGAGDVKLMALICGFLGLRIGSISILFGFLIGAVMGLIKLLVQRSLIRRLSYLFAYLKRLILTKEAVAYHIPARDGYDHTIPFGLCLFLGTLICSVMMNF